MNDKNNYNIKEYPIKKVCESCGAIFQSSLLDDEIYCKNCKDLSNDDFTYNDYSEFVNNSCRTVPVFYD